jgi:hypothetical protein
VRVERFATVGLALLAVAAGLFAGVFVWAAAGSGHEHASRTASPQANLRGNGEINAGKDVPPNFE